MCSEKNQIVVVREFKEKLAKYKETSPLGSGEGGLLPVHAFKFTPRLPSFLIKRLRMSRQP